MESTQRSEPGDTLKRYQQARDSLKFAPKPILEIDSESEHSVCEELKENERYSLDKQL